MENFISDPVGKSAVQELSDKISVLVRNKFNGSWRDAFTHYDGNGDGKLDRFDIRNVLTAANIGNVFTQIVWVKGILSFVDEDRDGLISWEEFAKIIKEKP